MRQRDGTGRDRKKQIIRAAIHCLARDGYAMFRLRSVAAAANLNQGLLHYYFKDEGTTAQHAILNAALKATTDKVRHLLETVETGEDARKRLHSLITGLLELDGDTRRVLLQFWSKATHEKDIDRATGGVYRELRTLIRRIFRDGQKSGMFRWIEQDKVGVAVLGIVEGIALQRLLSPSTMSSRAASELCEYLVASYLNKEGAGTEASSMTSSLRRAQKKSYKPYLTSSANRDDLDDDEDELDPRHGDGLDDDQSDDKGLMDRDILDEDN
jgi:AcrR family transcriptional regulator